MFNEELNLFQFQVSIILLIVLLYYEWRIWKIRCLISPAFYFAIIWLMGSIALIILHQFDVYVEAHPEYLNELNLYVCFTAVCFIIISGFGKNKITKGNIELHFFHDETFFAFLSIIYFLGSLVEFIAFGANFNIANSRLVSHVNIANRYSIIAIISNLSIPLSVFAGYKIISKIVLRQKYNLFESILYLLPLFSSLIFSINLGGRVEITYSFVRYIVGGVLALEKNVKFYNIKKIIISFLLIVFMIIIYIYINGSLRTKDSNNINQYTLNLYLRKYSPLLVPLQEPMLYALSSYNGYQYRRIDAVDLTHLGYGMYTFNGFINWTLPFLGRFGLKNLSIAKLFNIYYDVKETYDYERIFYFTTHSCYLTIIKDFGQYGAFGGILLLTIVAHFVFVCLQTRQEYKYSYYLWPYFLFFEYWCKSNFLGTLSSSVLNSLLGFLMVDIGNIIWKNLKKLSIMNNIRI